MPYNRQKMENALLALIGALEFEDGRFWKGYDFDLLNSLHEQDLILCGVFASFPSRYRFQGTDLYTCA